MRSVIQALLRHFLWEGVGVECENTFNFYSFISLLNIGLFNRFAVCNIDALSIWKCFLRTLIIDPNIRNHFSIIVLTYKPPPNPQKKKTNKKQKTKNKKTKNKKQKRKQEIKQKLL